MECMSAQSEAADVQTHVGGIKSPLATEQQPAAQQPSKQPGTSFCKCVGGLVDPAQSMGSWRCCIQACSLRPMSQ
jgi:hypothetical protein